MSVLSQVVGLPGMRDGITASHRVVFRGGDFPGVLPLGRVISGACTRDPGNTPDVTKIRAGMIFGKISTVVNSLGTVDYYAPSILGVTTNAEAAGATTIETSAATAVELVRRRGSTGTFNLIGPGSAAGVVITELVTYSAVNQSTGAITATAITNNFIAGSFICPTDGSQDPLTFLPNGWPLRVTDADGNNKDVEFPMLPVSGVVDSAQLLPVWPSDTSLQEWLVSRLNRAGGGKYVFDHTY